jgi:hypothetical protein
MIAERTKRSLSLKALFIAVGDVGERTLAEAMARGVRN